MKKPAMQLRHAPVRDQDHAQVCQARQTAALCPRNLKTLDERASREFLQGRDWNTNGPLPVVHHDFGRSASRDFWGERHRPILELLRTIELVHSIFRSL